MKRNPKNGLKQESRAAMDEARVERYRATVLALLAGGLPPMPAHLFRLTWLLASHPVDLKQVAATIRADRRLTRRLLELTSSNLFGQQRRVRQVEEATILMGTERLRNLVFSGYLSELSGRQMAESATMAFWAHALATAMLSERVARAIGYDRPQRAYQSGLMHDMGKLPLLMVAASEGSVPLETIERDDARALALERKYFGLDHCQAGRGLAISWNFDPGQTEVLEWHHHPERARFDPELVGIVAVADHFCQLAEAGESAQPSAVDDFYRAALPRLSEQELAELLALLEQEYPIVQRQLEFRPGDSGPQPAAPRETEGQPA
jgi:HD-like signal output (HDOD) protein